MALPSLFRTFAPPTVLFALAELDANVPTSVVSGPKRLTTFYLSNTDVNERLVDIQNSAGVYLVKQMVLSPGPAPQFDRVFMYVNGLIITPNGIGVMCQTEGYPHVM